MMSSVDVMMFVAGSVVVNGLLPWMDRKGRVGHGN